MAGKKNRITTTTTTNVQDRRIGAEGGSTIVSEGGSLSRSFTDNTRISESFQLVDSDTAQSSVDALRDVSIDAIGSTGDTALGLFEGVQQIVGRAFDFSEAAGQAQQQTVSAAIDRTASEDNQALETIMQGAMVIAAAFFLSRAIRG